MIPSRGCGEYEFVGDGQGEVTYPRHNLSLGKLEDHLRLTLLAFGGRRGRGRARFQRSGRGDFFDVGIHTMKSGEEAGSVGERLRVKLARNVGDPAKETGPTLSPVAIPLASATVLAMFLDLDMAVEELTMKRSPHLLCPIHLDFETSDEIEDCPLHQRELECQVALLGLDLLRSGRSGCEAKICLTLAGTIVGGVGLILCWGRPRGTCR